MALNTVFFIIALSLIVIIGLLWLLSRLTHTKEPEITAYEEIMGIKPPMVDDNSKHEEDKPRSTTNSIETPPVEDLRDDLKIIEGIGPKIESVLRDSGINTYAQLAVTQEIILESILMDADIKMANPTTWREQAALAEKGYWDELKTLQDNLVAGRQVD
jgi:predicted flap endonuclease-1-like 5' DNA nuclease